MTDKLTRLRYEFLKRVNAKVMSANAQRWRPQLKWAQLHQYVKVEGSRVTITEAGTKRMNRT